MECTSVAWRHATQRLEFAERQALYCCKQPVSYFYHMTKTRLTKDSQFIVGEAKVLNYVLAILCFAIFSYGVADAIKRDFKNIDYQSYVFALLLIPVVLFIRKAHNGRVYIRVNRNGIYQDEKLLTGWRDLIKVSLDQKEKTGLVSIRDNFLLVVEYRKDNKGLRKKIPLTNTQNKSEEEVLEAVNFFWRLYKSNGSK